MLSPLKVSKKRALFFLKKAFCVFLVYSGVCRLFSFIYRNQVKILLYHGIINTELDPMLNREGLHLDLESFTRQMAYLKRHYHILDMNEFIGYLKESKPLPKYGVVITFDDGYKNNYESLKDVIARYKIPVTIFLATDYVGTNELLWLDKLEMVFFRTEKKGLPAFQSMGISGIEWRNDEEKMGAYLILKNYLKKLPHNKLNEALKMIFSELGEVVTHNGRGNGDAEYTRLLDSIEVAELAGCGARLGSHTCRHEILTALSDEEAEGTLKRSYSRVKEFSRETNIPFAYPNGSFNETIKKKVADAGYSCALTTEHGFNSKDSDLYALKRNEIGNRGDIHMFIATLSGALDFIKSFVMLRRN